VLVAGAALPAGFRRTSRRWAARVPRGSAAVGLAAVGLHAGVFWLWHIPAWYDAAVAHPVLHAFEHTTLLGAGLLFWWVVLGVRWQGRTGIAVLYLFLAGLASGALAALLTLAPTPLYHAHLTTSAAWGLSPLEDQQLAGAIMWVPGGLVYLVAALVLFVRWLQAGPPPAVLPLVSVQ
jgi:cytochrome c oxidase assembly factor CtaG